ncbi:DUF4870 domain-containing protein [Fodinibius sp. AD559]|uniref:DUF4870 domain-containing protein n=1 Tax=Fodinibius sp. AD559 TaxID=3424179 RepID=UPI004046B5DC
MDESELTTETGSNNNSKLIAILSYITIIGWIIAFLIYKNNQEKPKLAGFHLRQSLGLMILGLLVGVVQSVLSGIPVIGWLIGFLMMVISLALLIFWVMGILKAIGGEREALPFIGQPTQDLLKDVIK